MLSCWNAEFVYPFNSTLSNADTSGSSNDYYIAKLETITGSSKENFSSGTIAIFPNPTTSQLNITSIKTIDEVKITDVLGQLVYRAKPRKKNVVVQLDRDGLYFVSVTMGEQIVTRKLIVKQ